MAINVYKMSLYNILVVARGFPPCKLNRIPDKMLDSKMSENGKLDKMPRPDNLTRTLTLTSL